MKTKSLLFAILLGALYFRAAGLCAETSARPVTSAANAKEDALYSEGTRAINDAHWAQAETIFTNIVQLHGERAEAALYWKAYAENKQGNPTRALDDLQPTKASISSRQMDQRVRRAGNRDPWKEQRSSAAPGRTG